MALTWDDTESVIKINRVVESPATEVKSAILYCDVFNHKLVYVDDLVFGEGSVNPVRGLRSVIEDTDNAPFELAVYLHVPVEGRNPNRAVQGEVLTQVYLNLSRVLSCGINQKHWDDPPQQVHDHNQEKGVGNWAARILNSFLYGQEEWTSLPVAGGEVCHSWDLKQKP